MKKGLNKSTGIFCLSIGILNLGFWSMLIFTGNVPDIESKLLSYVFHWISEFATAILLILCGFSLLSSRLKSRKLIPVSLGMLFNASFGALGYYLVISEISMITMMAAISIITLYFIIRNVETKQSLIFLFTGFVIYSSLNLLGNELEKKNYELLFYILPGFILSVWVAINFRIKN